MQPFSLKKLFRKSYNQEENKTEKMYFRVPVGIKPGYSRVVAQFVNLQYIIVQIVKYRHLFDVFLT
jgi:hypothetical protein